MECVLQQEYPPKRRNAMMHPRQPVLSLTASGHFYRQEKAAALIFGEVVGSHLCFRKPLRLLAIDDMQVEHIASCTLLRRSLPMMNPP
jgi:hypothetical protein